MLELEQLIDKFWAGRTTTDENMRLIDLLKQYNDSLKNEDQIFEVFPGDYSTSLAPERAVELLHRIHDSLGIAASPERRLTGRPLIRTLVRKAAIAAVLGGIAVSLFLLKVRHTDHQTGHSTPGVAVAIPTAPHLVRVHNDSNTTKSIILEDGSVVQLQKGGSIAYYGPFIDNRRDISLSGNAVFTVARDKYRPFTVYAGNIATRALGTRFLVEAAGTGNVKVRLLEGKIVVMAASKAGLTMNDIYLTPGQEFAFDGNSRQYMVSTFEVKSAKKTQPEESDRPELVFHKEPLYLVFKKIGDLYRVPLVFTKEDLNGLYFTGTFLKSDNLDIVLSSICNVNDLHVEKQQDSIIITKSN